MRTYEMRNMISRTPLVVIWFIDAPVSTRNRKIIIAFRLELGLPPGYPVPTGTRGGKTLFQAREKGQVTRLPITMRKTTREKL
eukprot:1382287-Amorphochlora_amoeboformis.AAC.1